MSGILTRACRAAATGIALAASGAASAGAAGVAGSAARVSAPVNACVARGFFKGKVTAIRTATGTARKAIKVGRGPIAIAITPDGGVGCRKIEHRDEPGFTAGR